MHVQANILSGNLLPLEIKFNTFLRNGLLMHAFSNDMVSFLSYPWIMTDSYNLLPYFTYLVIGKASSIQVGIRNGHIEVNLHSGEEKATLASLHSYYSNGANQFISLSLSQSEDLHILELQSPQEVIRTTLPCAEPLDALLNYTNISLCGAPAASLVDNATRSFSNFTGCVALSSGVELDPLPLLCDAAHQDGQCPYCLNEVWLPVSLWTKYVV